MSHQIEFNLPDGDWTCRWIGDLYYKKDPLEGGITVESKVSYSNSATDPITIRASVYNLFVTIAGSQLRVKDQFLRSFYANAQYEPKRKVYLVPISGKALTDSSRRIYRHMGISGSEYSEIAKNEPFLRDIVHRLRLPAMFGHSHAHCIPNTNPAYSVDYFLVPSYEVLRYFFLHEGGLTRELLSYFTGLGEHITRSLNDLFIHPNQKPAIVQDGAHRTASLFVREGLTDPEIHCLARLAFISEAYDCLQMVRDSLLLSSLENNMYGYDKLKTIFPQNKPFELAVCGQRLSWQDKTYLLVDQIYDVKEELPYDQLLYLTLTDHRSQAVLPEEAKTVVTQRVTPRTSPASPSKQTDSKLGDTNQPANLTSFLLTGYSFDDKPEAPIKVEKAGQTTRYQTPALALIAQNLISLQERAQAQADAGRGKSHRQDNTRYAPGEQPPTTLFEALRQLDGYTCSYFNLSRDTPSFNHRFYINHQRGLSRPFDILLCRLESKNHPKTSIYLVWANTIRYGIFYAPALRHLPWAVLTELCNDYFGQDGVYAFGHEGVHGPLLKGQMKAYDRRNQLGKRPLELAKKISDELDDIMDDQVARFR